MNPDKHAPVRPNGNGFTHRPIQSAVLVSLVVFVVGILMLTIPTVIRLGIEGIYPYEEAATTYHFTIANPSLPDEMMHLDIGMLGSKPAIMSHTSIHAQVYLRPNIEWRAQNNLTNEHLEVTYVLILTGTKCYSASQTNKLGDGTCIVPMSRGSDGNYNSGIDIRYYTSGDFPVYLAKESLFHGTVSRSVDQYIVVAPIEQYLANEYTYTALIVAIFTSLFVGGIEIYRLRRKD